MIDRFAELKKADITRALKFGQALATLNCQSEGARGLMNKRGSICLGCEIFRVSQTCYRCEKLLSVENEKIAEKLSDLTREHPRLGAASATTAWAPAKTPVPEHARLVSLGYSPKLFFVHAHF